MSYSRIYFAKEDGDLGEGLFANFQNSWGFGAFVFGSMVNRYARDFAHVKMTPEQLRENGSMLSDWFRLWNWVAGTGGLVQPALPAFELNTLVAGYDSAYVQGADDLRMLARSFEMFSADHATTGRVNHLPDMAKALLKGADQGAQYACFYPMSVVSDPWWIEDDPKTGDGHRFRFLDPKDADHPRQRYQMAPVDGPKVTLDDLVKD